MRHGLGASQVSIVTLSTGDGAQINMGVSGGTEIQRYSSDVIFSLTKISPDQRYSLDQVKTHAQL